MTPEYQRIAIAEKCGWMSIQKSGRLDGQLVGYPPNGLLKRQEIPDFTSDLNAMREAWKTLNTDQRAKFAEELAYIVLGVINDPRTEFVFSRCSLSLFANAAAHEHAESFLRALGLWQDDPAKSS